MAKAIIDLTGRTFGQLKVLGYAGKDRHGASLWKCICTCGNKCVKRGHAIRSGETRSCGCLATAKGKGAIHGMHRTSEYRAWESMKQRCYNKKSNGYPDYGGRGIRVCAAWRHSFVAFFSYVGFKPSTKHSLERKDNDGNYEPGNVRWATKIEQSNNRRSTRVIAFQGRRLTLRGWARHTKISDSVLCARLDYHGWSVERTLTTPVRTFRSKHGDVHS